MAPGTINLRLGAIRRLAYEAADCGLLWADLAAGIRRVKGVKNLGVRLGNWLTAEQGYALSQVPNPDKLIGKRDRAMLCLLVACGLRSHEVVGLKVDDLQRREEHWAIVDIVGKAGHVRTVPIPDWVWKEVNNWLMAAGIERGKIFRRVSKIGKTSSEPLTAKAVWNIVKDSARRIPTETQVSLPMTCFGSRCLRSVCRDCKVPGSHPLVAICRNSISPQPIVLVVIRIRRYFELRDWVGFQLFENDADAFLKLPVMSVSEVLG